MHQVSRTVDSITLSWSQPDQPNGVILDYELQYYEKVPNWDSDGDMVQKASFSQAADKAADLGQVHTGMKHGPREASSGEARHGPRQRSLTCPTATAF